MLLNAKLLIKNELPDWFDYPKEFLRIVNQNLFDFEPWLILSGARLHTRFHGLKNNYPNRNLIPFARRIDNDDIACWEDNTYSVVVIHDFSSPGYEDSAKYSMFWDWFRAAIEDMIEFDV